MDSASPDATCIAGEQSTTSGTFTTFASTFSNLAEKPVMAGGRREVPRQSHRHPVGHGSPQ